MVLLAAPLVLLGWQGWARRWITDDGYIYLRVVRQLEAGNGPVYNGGQRVEAFTSPLWLAMLWLVDRITPVKLEWMAIGLGIFLTLVGVAFAMAGAARLVGRDTKDALFVPVGAALLASLVPMWIFASGGLETGLVFTWLGACFWLLVDWARSGRRLRAPGAILIGLGWIVRPELAVYSVAFVALVLLAQWRGDGWPRRLGLLAIALALPVGYQLFRMGYYGSLVTNTAIAKEASRARWDLGWRYLADCLAPYWLFIPLALLALGVATPLIRVLRRSGEHRALWLLVAIALAAACNALYIVRMGGDYMHARLLMPALFVLCLPVAVAPAERRYVAAGLVVAWSIAGALWLRPPPENTRVRPFILPPKEMWRFITLEQQGWNEGGFARKWYQGPALYQLEDPFGIDFHKLDVEPAPDVHLPTALLFGIGLPAYAMGPQLDVLDLYGLADWLTAHLELTRRGFTGHEKSLPIPWAAARVTAATSRPRASEFPLSPVVLIPTTNGSAFDEQVAWARAALSCPAVRELEQSTTAPLTARRFFANVTHAFANMRLRIPPDPETAYRRFCGPGTPPEVALVRAPR
jgi:arabinofuranosyltransferase